MVLVVGDVHTAMGRWPGGGWYRRGRSIRFPRLACKRWEKASATMERGCLPTARPVLIAGKRFESFAERNGIDVVGVDADTKPARKTSKPKASAVVAA
jgi:hypothetical protein